MRDAICTREVGPCPVRLCVAVSCFFHRLQIRSRLRNRLRGRPPHCLCSGRTACPRECGREVCDV